MTPKSKHPDRRAMIASLKSHAVPFYYHLATCKSCAELYKTLKLVDQASEKQIDEPGNVYDLKAIALKQSAHRATRSRRGKLIHDSWSDIPTLQQRASDYSAERRLRFALEKVVLELVVEKSAGLFELVARVYDDGVVSTGYVLQVGRRRLIPRNHGCFYWSAEQPPRQLRLISPTTKIELGSLPW